MAESKSKTKKVETKQNTVNLTGITSTDSVSSTDIPILTYSSVELHKRFEDMRGRKLVITDDSQLDIYSVFSLCFRLIDNGYPVEWIRFEQDKTKVTIKLY